MDLWHPLLVLDFLLFPEALWDLEGQWGLVVLWDQCCQYCLSPVQGVLGDRLDLWVQWVLLAHPHQVHPGDPWDQECPGVQATHEQVDNTGFLSSPFFFTHHMHSCGIRNTLVETVGLF